MASQKLNSSALIEGVPKALVENIKQAAKQTKMNIKQAATKPSTSPLDKQKAMHAAHKIEEVKAIAEDIKSKDSPSHGKMLAKEANTKLKEAKMIVSSMDHTPAKTESLQMMKLMEMQLKMASSNMAIKKQLETLHQQHSMLKDKLMLAVNQGNHALSSSIDNQLKTMEQHFNHTVSEMVHKESMAAAGDIQKSMMTQMKLLKDANATMMKNMKTLLKRTKHVEMEYQERNQFFLPYKGEGVMKPTVEMTGIV